MKKLEKTERDSLNNGMFKKVSEEEVKIEMEKILDEQYKEKLLPNIDK